MQLILQQPGTAFPGGKFAIDIDRSVKSLLFRFAWTPGNGPVQDAANSPLKSFLPASLLTSYVTTKDAGQVKICTALPLSALMEYAAAAEGAIFTKANPAVPLEINEVSGWVDLTPMGALHMSDDEQIRIQLEDLPTAATFNLTVYALEAPVLDYAVLTYDQLSIGTNVRERTFDLSGIDTLIIPTTGGVIKEMLFRYSNGNAARYTEEEFRFICQNSNDLAVAGAVTNYGFSSHYVFNVDNAIAVDVVTSGAGLTFFSVSDSPITKSQPVAQKNAALVSTTENVLLDKLALINNK